MIVTRIHKNKSNFDIYLDDELAFTLSDYALLRLKLVKGMEFVPTEQVNEILVEDELIRCKNRGIAMVSLTQKSVKVLKKKLLDEGFSEETVDKTLDFMEDYSMTDDLELAKSLIRKGDRNHNSKRQIKQKLYEKGISKEDAQITLEEFNIDEKENALSVAIKKYKSLRNKSTDEILRKVEYALSYRGFSYDAAKYAKNEIKKLLEENEEFEE